LTLVRQGRLDEAIAEFRSAIGVDASFAPAHSGLAEALHRQGRLEEAIDERRAEVRLAPDSPDARYNLGNLLSAAGRGDEAIAAYRASLRLAPEFAEAHCNLAAELQRAGRFAEALAEYERGHALASRRENWPYPSDEWVRQARRLVALDGRLAAVLQGRDRPADADELVGFADLCYKKQLNRDSARLWQEAFRAQPALAEDLRAEHRYAAACAAALAGWVRGKDEPPPDEAARARWRRQALDWLRADLGARTRQLQEGTPLARSAVQDAMSHWMLDPDFAGVRDPEALAKLPEAERADWRALWSAVDGLLGRSRAGSR
jgi:serine/threonine-protein kinase